MARAVKGLGPVQLATILWKSKALSTQRPK